MAVDSGTLNRVLLGAGSNLILAAGATATQFTSAQLVNAAIAGLGLGNGIDVNDLIPGSASFNFTANAGGGVMGITDGSHGAQFQLNGSYSSASFHLAADGHGGTLLSYG